MPKKLVLVVSNLDVFAELIGDAIEWQLQVSVEYAVSAVETMRFSQTARPSLILLDLPESPINGLDLALCQRLKYDPSTRAIPVIAFADPFHTAQLVGTGCDAVIETPVELGAVVETVRRWLSQSTTAL